MVAEAELGLVRERGYRASALVCVNHEQVNGIGADVEDTQSPTLTLPRPLPGVRTRGPHRRPAVRHRPSPASPTSPPAVYSDVTGWSRRAPSRPGQASGFRPGPTGHSLTSPGAAQPR